MPQPPNIYIVGAQCTGKTTLINNLRGHFDNNRDPPQEPPLLITEIARTALREHSFKAADVREATKSGQWFVSDRLVAGPIAYALRYVDQGRAKGLVQSDEWQELKVRMQNAVVIVCEASQEVDSWLDVDDWFLEKQEIEYAVLSAGVGNHQERVQYELRHWSSNKV
ncbi:hypothetical protein QBC36DRAFT_350818 [Triangularia setosa]|uniref:NadR/Ttd14 AAA domain-containing protein n=1 Tax=Triangularia setosa TaxID=2587417 RepID=A0AAN6VVY3_9PEZI|nr:hypothetical protein QBC36DRAFT_350818 [Podospora setosa]